MKSSQNLLFGRIKRYVVKGFSPGDFGGIDPAVRSATLLVSAVPIEGEIGIDSNVVPEPWTVKFSADRLKLRLVKRSGLSVTVK